MPSRAALVVALGLAAAACGGRAAIAPPAAPIGNQLAPDAAPARAAVSLREALAMMPANTDLVVEIDVAQLRGSVLWDLIGPPFRDAVAGQLSGYGPCSAGFLDAVDSALLGVHGTDGDMVLFVRGVAQRDLFACAARFGDAHANQIHIDGDLLEVSEGGEVTVRLRFVDDATLVTGREAGAITSAATLARLAAARPGDGLTSSRAFLTMFERVDTTRTAWWILNGSYAPLQGLPMKLRAIRGEIHAGTDPSQAVATSIVLHAEDANGATQIAMGARIAIGQLHTTPMAELARTINVAEHDTEVQIDARLDLAQVQRLVALMRGAAVTP